MKSTMIPTLMVVIVGVVTITGCNEQGGSQYPTVAAASQAGVFERGWLPAVLNPDVTDIREWHDLDTNEVRGRFALNQSVLHRLQLDCGHAADLPRHIRSAPSWWPDSIARGETGSSLGVFRCANFFVAADTTNGVGYFWANGR